LLKNLKVYGDDESNIDLKTFIDPRINRLISINKLGFYVFFDKEINCYKILPVGVVIEHGYSLKIENQESSYNIMDDNNIKDIMNRMLKKE
jgi:hypothetical protein